MARRAAQGWNVLPHSKKRDVLPAGQQPQAVMRHLCLGKGNVIWDIKTKALFSSPRESGAYSGIRVHGEPPGNAVASARVTTSAPHWLQAPALTGWGLGPQRRMGLCPAIPKGDFWV